MTHSIRCDACSARAYLYAAKIINPNGVAPLHFCGYHARKHKEELNSDGWLLSLVVDEVHEPNPEAEDADRESTALFEWLSSLADL